MSWGEFFGVRYFLGKTAARFYLIVHLSRHWSQRRDRKKVVGLSDLHKYRSK